MSRVHMAEKEKERELPRGFFRMGGLGRDTAPGFEERKKDEQK